MVESEEERVHKVVALEAPYEENRRREIERSRGRRRRFNGAMPMTDGGREGDEN